MEKFIIHQLNPGGDKSDGKHIIREAYKLPFSPDNMGKVANESIQINVFEPLFNNNGQEENGQKEKLEKSLKINQPIVLTGSELTLTEKEKDLARAEMKSTEEKQELQKIYNRADLLSLSAIERAKEGGKILAICYGFQSIIHHLNPDYIKSSGNWIVGRNKIIVPEGFGDLTPGEYSITSSFKDIVLMNYLEDTNGNSIVEDEEKIIYILRGEKMDLANFNEPVRPVAGIFIKYKNSEGTILALRDHPELTQDAYKWIFEGPKGVIAKRSEDDRFKSDMIKLSLTEEQEKNLQPSIDIVAQYLDTKTDE